MSISVGFAVSRAVARTRYVLFSTFDVKKWLALGLCAFLSQCDAGGGGGYNFSNIPGRWGPPAPPRPTTVPATGPGSQPATQASTQPHDVMHAWIQWISANWLTVSVVILAGILAAFAATALFTWLASRGKFMFIDGIVQNHGAVVEPWGAFKQLGNSLFGWSLLLNLIGFSTGIAIVVIGAAIAWPDLRAQHFGGMAITAIVSTAVLFIATSLAFMLVRMLLLDFVVPAMYLHNLRVRPAWQLVKREIVAGYLGEIVLFYLMKILLMIVITGLSFAATCATCCITAVPFVGTVILLPFAVFMRCYGLCFIEQFGPRWTVFFDANQRCRSCGYDLRYSPQSPVCPECGTPRENFTAPVGVHPPTSPPNGPSDASPTA